MSVFKQTFRALRHPNYRLWFAGQGVSLLGTWMQQLAMSWLVYRLTGSKMMLGTVAFAASVPALALAPFAGVLLDRLDRYKVVLVTQTLSMLQAAVLATLVLSGHVRVWHLAALGFALGAINAFDMPARQAFVPEMLERREDLPGAIALNSALFNTSRLIGPVLAGVAVAAIGEGPCFAVNAASFLAVLGCLLMMRLPKRPPRAARPQGAMADLKAGFDHVRGNLPIRDLLLMLAVGGLAGATFQVLMPVFAVDVLHGDSRTQGMLASAVGAGALAATLALASRRSVVGLARWIGWAGVLFGLGLAAYAHSRTPWLSALLLLPVGVGMLLVMAGTNTLVQTMVDDDMRGRVMSLHAMSMMGTLPLGSLMAGWLAERIGPEATVRLGGLVCALAAGVFLHRLPKFRAHARPILARKGIALPPARDVDVVE